MLPFLAILALVGSAGCSSSVLDQHIAQTRRQLSGISDMQRALAESVRRNTRASEEAARRLRELEALLSSLQTDLGSVARDQQSLDTEMKGRIAKAERKVDEMASRVSELRLILLRNQAHD